MRGGLARTCIRGGGLGLAAVAAGVGLASVAVAAAAAPQRPQRIVSVNLCTDELALRLARPGTVASVSYLSRRPDTSNVVAEAAAIPVNYGLVEDVVSFRPDLVLAGLYTTRNTVTLLRALAVPVVEIDTPPSIDGVRQQIRDVGALLDGAERAEAQIKAFDARLPRVDPHAPRPRAVVVRASGFTTGPGTLLNDILTRAGIDNLAAAGPLAGQAQPPLEAVIQARPDMLILTDEEGEAPALAGEVLVHPALKALAKHARVVTLPARLWTCSGPGVAEAVARLALAADDWRAAHRAGAAANQASLRPESALPGSAPP